MTGASASALDVETEASRAEQAREIVCRNGARVRLRSIRDDDAPRLVALHARLSQQTIYQRFFAAIRRLSTDWARYLAVVDHHRRLALVVEHGPLDTPEIIAVARYEPTSDPAVVEVAFVVEDRWQGQGIGTVLFDALLRAAERRGFHGFRAYVLGDNTRMLDLIKRFGRVGARSLDSGVLTLDFTRAPGLKSPRP